MLYYVPIKGKSHPLCLTTTRDMSSTLCIEISLNGRIVALTVLHRLNGKPRYLHLSWHLTDDSHTGKIVIRS